MLRNTKDLEDYTLGATDGPIGHVKDFYFDDDTWVIRYLVVDTSSWLASRKVLISPIAIGKPDWVEQMLPAALTKLQVKNSPDIDTDKPVTRQHEKDYLGHYGYPYYWGGAGLWGSGGYPYMMLPGYAGYGSESAARAEANNAQARAEASHRHDDPHLRSCKAVIGYKIQAIDGEIGHVQGMLLDDETWAIRYLVINTSNWWLGHELLVAPPWILGVSWADGTVSVDMTRQALKDAPPYDSRVPLGRQHELDTYGHHGRPGYWPDEVKL